MQKIITNRSGVVFVVILAVLSELVLLNGSTDDALRSLLCEIVILTPRVSVDTV